MSYMHINEYRHTDGDTQGAVVGSDLDKVLAKEEDWTLVGKGSPAQPAQAAAEEDQEAPEKTEGEQSSDEGTNGDAGGTAEPVDLESLNRDELDELASKLGIEDAETLPNKGAVKDAIKAAQAAAEEG